VSAKKPPRSAQKVMRQIVRIGLQVDRVAGSCPAPKTDDFVRSLGHHLTSALQQLAAELSAPDLPPAEKIRLAEDALDALLADRPLHEWPYQWAVLGPLTATLRAVGAGSDACDECVLWAAQKIACVNGMECRRIIYGHKNVFGFSREYVLRVAWAAFREKQIELCVGIVEQLVNAVAREALFGGSGDEAMQGRFIECPDWEAAGLLYASYHELGAFMQAKAMRNEVLERWQHLGDFESHRKFWRLLQECGHEAASAMIHGLRALEVARMLKGPGGTATRLKKRWDNMAGFYPQPLVRAAPRSGRPHLYNPFQLIDRALQYDACTEEEARQARDRLLA